MSYVVVVNHVHHTVPRDAVDSVLGCELDEQECCETIVEAIDCPEDTAWEILEQLWEEYGKAE